MKSPSSYLREQVVANLIINFTIAYGLSSLILSNLEFIPITAPVDQPFHPNMAGDLIVGTAITGLIVTLIVTLITRLLIKVGRVNRGSYGKSVIADQLPNALLSRGLFVGVLSALSFAVPASMFLQYLDLTLLKVSTYILWHSVYCGMIGGIISYFVCIKALSEDRT